MQGDVGTMNIKDEHWEFLQGRLDEEIQVLDGNMAALEAVLAPFQGPSFSGISGLHGSFRDDDVANRISVHLDELRKRSDRVLCLASSLRLPTGPREGK